MEVSDTPDSRLPSLPVSSLELHFAAYTMAEGCHSERFGVFGRTSKLTSHKTSTSLLLASFAPRASKVRRMTFLGEGGCRATSFQDFEKKMQLSEQCQNHSLHDFFVCNPRCRIKWVPDLWVAITKYCRRSQGFLTSQHCWQGNKQIYETLWNVKTGQVVTH